MDVRQFHQPLDAARAAMRRAILSVSLVFAAIPATAEEAIPPRPDRFATELKPFLTTHCADCHAGEFAEAGLDVIAPDSEKELLDDLDSWDKILLQVKVGSMPPADFEPQPTAADRAGFVKGLDDLLNQQDCSVPHPGRATARRLNRIEYRNTIRDLCGIEFDAADHFPSDDVGNGFDNQADILTVSPLMLEKYLTAAEQIAEEAIVVDLESTKDIALDLTGSFLWDRTETRTVELPEAGRYKVTVRAMADQGGDEPTRMEVLLDGKRLRRFDIRGNQREREYELTFDIEQAGSHNLSVAFVNDHYVEAEGSKSGVDRNLYVNGVKLWGPEAGAPRPPEHHRQIVSTDPRRAGSLNKAARQVTERFAGRAFRRTATKAEITRFAALTTSIAESSGSFELGVRAMVQAVLISPEFLFRVEQPVEQGPDRQLSDHELATRLSYFLTSTLPDEELRRAADAGRLRTDKQIESQVRRLLKEQKTIDALNEGFFAQWLNLRNLDATAPEPELYRKWNTKLARAMRRETELFAEEIVRKDRSILDFLTADYTYVNPRLAELYDIKWRGKDPLQLYLDSLSGRELSKVKRKDSRGPSFPEESTYLRVDLPKNRRGVLTQAAVLAVTSNPVETSPVKRGKWVLENILGTPPPPAPANIPPLDEAKEAAPDLPLREQLALHRESSACFSCHASMDPIGLAFENYDVLGIWREKFDGHRIDSSGELPERGEFEDAVDLIDLLASERRLFATNFVRKMMTYALGRTIDRRDRCAVERIVDRAEKNGFRFSEIIVGIALSDPFTMRASETN
ncbi:DUF1592 domain-containing protein [Stratiformator vulcanicus]|uniref:Planctomycete cytochrome C n=1 Tax=Stratiformator vulcanicus TaxID=2527980 RepID=A0A517R6R3_9PLAN|nr:DUF1592 domain-containing protein [Stratiformator vulcanicus]QDT39521.1 hypothetical protein Pan189_39290 [Stratiformator vulcanicus]